MGDPFYFSCTFSIEQSVPTSQGQLPLKIVYIYMHDDRYTFHNDSESHKLYPTPTPTSNPHPTPTFDPPDVSPRSCKIAIKQLRSTVLGVSTKHLQVQHNRPHSWPPYFSYASDATVHVHMYVQYIEYVNFTYYKKV